MEIKQLIFFTKIFFKGSLKVVSLVGTDTSPDFGLRPPHQLQPIQRFPLDNPIPCPTPSQNNPLWGEDAEKRYTIDRFLYEGVYDPEIPEIILNALDKENHDLFASLARETDNRVDHAIRIRIEQGKMLTQAELRWLQENRHSFKFRGVRFAEEKENEEIDDGHDIELRDEPPEQQPQPQPNSFDIFLNAYIDAGYLEKKDEFHIENDPDCINRPLPNGKLPVFQVIDNFFGKPSYDIQFVKDFLAQRDLDLAQKDNDGKTALLYFIEKLLAQREITQEMEIVFQNFINYHLPVGQPIYCICEPGPDGKIPLVMLWDNREKLGELKDYLTDSLLRDRVFIQIAQMKANLIPPDQRTHYQQIIHRIINKKCTEDPEFESALISFKEIAAADQRLEQTLWQTMQGDESKLDSARSQQRVTQLRTSLEKYKSTILAQNGSYTYNLNPEIDQHSNSQIFHRQELIRAEASTLSASQTLEHNLQVEFKGDENSIEARLLAQMEAIKAYATKDLFILQSQGQSSHPQTAKFINLINQAKVIMDILTNPERSQERTNLLSHLKNNPQSNLARFWGVTSSAASAEGFQTAFRMEVVCPVKRLDNGKPVFYSAVAVNSAVGQDITSALSALSRNNRIQSRSYYNICWFQEMFTAYRENPALKQALLELCHQRQDDDDDDVFWEKLKAYLESDQIDQTETDCLLSEFYKRSNQEAGRMQDPFEMAELVLGLKREQAYEAGAELHLPHFTINNPPPSILNFPQVGRVTALNNLSQQQRDALENIWNVFERQVKDLQINTATLFANLNILNSITHVSFKFACQKAQEQDRLPDSSLLEIQNLATLKQKLMSCSTLREAEIILNLCIEAASLSGNQNLVQELSVYKTGIKAQALTESPFSNQLKLNLSEVINYARAKLKGAHGINDHLDILLHSLNQNPQFLANVLDYLNNFRQQITGQAPNTDITFPGVLQNAIGWVFQDDKAKYVLQRVSVHNGLHWRGYVRAKNGDWHLNDQGHLGNPVGNDATLMTRITEERANHNTVHYSFVRQDGHDGAIAQEVSGKMGQRNAEQKHVSNSQPSSSQHRTQMSEHFSNLYNQYILHLNDSDYTNPQVIANILDDFFKGYFTNKSSNILLSDLYHCIKLVEDALHKVFNNTRQKQGSLKFDFKVNIVRDFIRIFGKDSVESIFNGFNARELFYGPSYKTAVWKAATSLY